MKLPILLGCLLVTAKAASTRGNHRTSLEDIERDYSSGEQVATKANSPTKYGFVPQRTASSYAAAKPKYQYSQTNYQVKKSASKIKPQQTYVQYVQQPVAEAPVYYSQPQYLSVQQPQQYENVQYVTDNSISQPEQPQYYFVQQYQSPSTAVESVIDPKEVQQYLTYYSPNSIASSDEKYLQPYYTKSEPQLPPVTVSTKYTSVSPTQSTKQKEVKYVMVPAKVQDQEPQQEIIIKREPKSLLDSYVPSVVQLQYLRQQGKLGYSKF